MMKKMMKKVVFWGLTALLGAAVTVNAAPAKRNVAKLSARGRSGTIAVQSDRADLPSGAKLTLSRQTDAATLEWVNTVVKARKGRGLAGAKVAPSILAAYDISIDEGKTAWQPAPGSPVRVTVTLDDPVAAADAAKLGVVHLADDGTAEALDASRYGFERDPETKAVTGFWVEATGFSIYAITDQSILKYSFYNGTTHVGDEYVKSGETLYDPGIGPGGLKYGETFVGWATSSTAATGKTIEELNAELTGTPGFASIYASNPDGITLYAIIKKAYYLRYLTQSGDELVVLKTEIVATDASDAERTFTIVDGASYAAAEHLTFESWLGSDGHIYRKNETVTLTDHLDLYIKVEGRYWLVFDANAGGPGSGATYTPPQLYITGSSGTTLSKPVDPVWTGYEFVSWNTQADGNGTTWTDATFNGAISADTTLYAQWNPLPVYYYVIYWQQSASDTSKYNYMGSDRRSANTGDTVNTTTADTTKGGTAGSEFGYYFTYNATKSDTSVEVKPDGTTMLNVYYDRRVITYNFQGIGETTTIPAHYEEAQYGRYGLIDGNYVQLYRLRSNGWEYRALQDNNTYSTVYYQSGNNSYTQYNGTRYSLVAATTVQQESFSGLYGTRFTEWPDAGSGKTWTDGTYNYPLALTLFDPLSTYNGNDPGSVTLTTVTFSTTSYSSSNYKLYVYVQTETGSWSYTDDYLLSSANLGTSGTWHPTETFTGFTVAGYQVGSSINANGNWTAVTSSGSISYNRQNIYLRYSRNTHNIKYMSKGENTTVLSEETVSGVYYGSGLSGYASRVPTNGKDGYAFLGWYEDEDLLVPFEFDSKTMPDTDLTVYAKWGQQRVRVVLDPGCTDYSFANNQALTFRLDYNEKISDANINYDTAQRSGYKLEGWYAVEDGVEFPWTFATQVNLAVDGVDMNYQTSDDWATNKYGDNDGRHENVKGILKLKAKWALELEESAVYIKYDMDPGYKVYDSTGYIQTVIPVDPNHYIWDADAGTVSFQVADAPTGYTSGFTFSKWVLLDAAGNRTNVSLDPGAPLTVTSANVKTQTVTDDLGNTHELRTINLVAQFTPDETKATMLTYDGQGGLTTAGNATDSTAMLVNESFTTADGSAFDRPGYTFTGWNTKADGSGTTVAGGVAYAADNKDGLAWDSDSEVNILYAQWTAKTDTPYKVGRYLQKDDDTYPDTADATIATRQGTTDTTATVIDADKAVPSDLAVGYELDETKNSEWSGNINGDGSRELKVFFKQKRCRVTFDKFDTGAPALADGDGQAFAPQSIHKGFGKASRPTADPAWSRINSFRGWMVRDPDGPYVDAENNHYSDYNGFDSQIITEDITLYAKWTYVVSFVVTGSGSNEMTFSFLIPFGDQIFNPGTTYAGSKPGFACEGWYRDGDETQSVVQFATREGVSERVPQGGVTYRQKWVAETDQTSSGRFLSLGSTYGMIDSISAGTTGPVTQSVKGRQLAARTAPQATFTLKHAVYPAYTYYTVLRCEDLTNPVWTAMEDSREVTGVTSTSVALPMEGKRGFFRLLLSTTPLTKGATKLDQ